MPTAATTAATVLTWVIAVGVIAIGVLHLWVPQAAADFGIPGTRPSDPVFRAWLSVLSGRDICLGLFLLIGLLGGSTHLRGWMMLAGSLATLGDALITKFSGGPAKAYYGIHGGTTVVMATAGAVLLLS